MALDALNGLRGAAALATDPGFLLNARRTLLPLPLVDRTTPGGTGVLPPFESRPIAALRGKRVVVVGGAGGGACVALVGVARALEEAAVEPSAVAACSGSALWAAMWAGGMTAGEMAGCSLSWRPEDHLGVQWAGLPRFALSAARGFRGIGSEEALEQLLGRRLWRMSAGRTAIPLHTLGYNLDRVAAEPLGSEDTPDLRLGELARIAVAPPRASEAVRVEGDLVADGAVLDEFPVGLVEDDADHVIGLNVMLAEIDADVTRRLGGRLTLVEPLPRERRRPMSFYELFLDRRDWPDLIGAGYRAATDALAPLRRRRKARA